MFLDLLRRRNPAFLDAVAALHARGDLPANCYVIDLDAVARNAARFVAEAERLGLTIFAMTKQLGRNPDVSRTLVTAGITHAVGVDLACAVAAANGGMRIGHVGHLVQVPRSEADLAASLKPRYWTVFNETKAREAAGAARARGRVQDVLLRVVGDSDQFYPGHEGGFPEHRLIQQAKAIDAIPGLRVAGVTSFPATLMNKATGAAEATPNRATLTRAAQALAQSGYMDVQVNAPGTTSVSVLGDLAAAGATQVEPGHGLTGTTPFHAARDLAEEPAVAYLTEVSHIWNDRAYVFGGGLYVDPVLGKHPTRAIVAPRGATSLAELPTREVEMPAPEAIDYYATIPIAPQDVAVGDTAVFGFRVQAFVTRALTAAVSGVGSGSPRVAGVWAADGSPRLLPHEVPQREPRVGTQP